jgi:integrase
VRTSGIRAAPHGRRSPVKSGADAPMARAQRRWLEHLSPAEVEKLIEAARANRYGPRDALMALLTFRHGLRAAEVVDLRWEQVDFKARPCTSAESRMAPRQRIL